MHSNIIKHFIFCFVIVIVPFKVSATTCVLICNDSTITIGIDSRAVKAGYSDFTTVNKFCEFDSFVVFFAGIQRASSFDVIQYTCNYFKKLSPSPANASDFVFILATKLDSIIRVTKDAVPWYYDNITKKSDLSISIIFCFKKIILQFKISVNFLTS